jgi:hypothetical protein
MKHKHEEVQSMRKVRDFDAELQALEERRKILRQRKIQQLGELVEATGADALDADRLAGALIAATEEKNGSVIASWTSLGARFFRETSRKSSHRARTNGPSGKAAQPGAGPV